MSFFSLSKRVITFAVLFISIGVLANLLFVGAIHAVEPQNLTAEQEEECLSLGHDEPSECAEHFTGLESGQSSGGSVNNITDFVNVVITVLEQAIIPLILALSVIAILWGAFKLILYSDNEQRRAEARNTLLYGIIGIFIMVSLWGLVAVLENTFNLHGDAASGPQLESVEKTGAPDRPSTFAELIDLVINAVLKPLIPLLIAAAVVVFLWGAFQLVLYGGNEQKRAEAKNTVVYGLIGIFIMVSLWGLVNVLENTFNFQDSVPDPPQFGS